MSKFDPDTPLVMGAFKTVLGFNLNQGTPLVIVENPSVAGEVTRAVAERLWASKIAKPRDEVHATPVETKEQEAARLMAANPLTGEQGEGELPEGFEPQADLVVWPEGSPKAGERVTNEDLRAIAKRERVVVEGDDNKVDLQVKIMAARAAKANGQDAEGQPRKPDSPERPTE